MSFMNKVISKIFQNAEKSPDKIAIYYKNESVTYQELKTRIITLGNAISSLTDLNPVAILLNRTPNMVVALLATWYAGRAFVALDPKHPLGRKKQIIEESQPSIIICEDETADLNLDVRISTIEKLKLYSSSISTSSVIEDEQLAYLLFTSGSTGKPKAISISHKSVNAFLCWAVTFFNDKMLECVLASTTITFDLSIFEIFVPLYKGTSLYIVDNTLELLDPNELFSRITLINTVPSAVRELVRARAIPKNVNTVNLAGEALYWNLVNDIYDIAPSVQQVFNLWGPSEDTTYSSYYATYRTEIRPNNGPVPIGKPVDKTEILILDDKLNILPLGEEGEICLTGDKLALGYYNNPELTSKSFLEIKYKNSLSRIYRTGDKGRMVNNGEVHFLGRLDFQVKIRGYRIELEEIENCLFELNEIKEAAVIAIKEEEDTKLVAFITIDATSDINDVKLKCSKKITSLLPSYMLPHKWFVQTEPLPRTTSGKIACNVLKNQYLTSTCIEKSQIPSNWNELIQYLLGKVNDHDQTFVALGGDSLSAARLKTLVKKIWNKRVDINEILSGEKTLAELEILIANRTPEYKIHDIKEISENNLSPIEYRMWKVYKSHRYPSCYNIGVSIVIDGNIDLERFASAFSKAITESRTLNKCIKFADSIPYFKELPAPKIPIISIDALKEQKKTLLETPFKLEEEAPLRSLLIKRSVNSSELYLSISHTAIDGIGLKILFSNIATVYQGLKVEKVSPKFYAQFDDLQEAISFWKEELCNIDETPLWPKPISLSEDGIYKFHIPKEEVERLSQKCVNQNITLPVLLMSSLSIAAQRLTGREDFILSCPVANRAEIENQTCITNLSNTLPIRLKFNRDTTGKEITQQIKNKLEKNLQWQHIPFDNIIDNLPGFSHEQTIFDFMFSYIDFLPGSLIISGCDIRPEFIQPKHAKVPLVVSAITTNEGGLNILFEYQGDRVSKDWVVSLKDLFEHLLLSKASLSYKLVENMDVIPPRQHEILSRLLKMNAQELLKSQENIVGWIESMVRKYPQKIAVKDTKRELTYQQLWDTAERIAAGLQYNGAHSGNAIGLSMARSCNLIVAIIGILRAGCHYVPLDPRNPVERNQYIATNSRIRCAIVDKKEYEKNYATVEYGQLLKTKNVYKEIDIHQGDLAYIIYTSGTTGQPKGVAITHKNVVRLFAACDKWGNFTETDHWTMFHSYAFDFSVWEIFGALFHGAELFVVPQDAISDMGYFADLLVQNKITILSMTPTAFKNFMASQVASLNHVPRMIVFGGEALKKEDLTSWWNKYTDNQTALINMYGITEITVHGTVYKMNKNSLGSCIGIPLEDLGFVIVDQREKMCSIGVPGEIRISGDGLSSGYLYADELNKKKFSYAEWLNIAPARYYHSGDLAVIGEDGNLYYLGRIDKQVKVNGHRVELEEISGIIKQFPGIEDCVVRVVEIDDKINMLAVWYVAQKDINIHDLLRQLQNKLPTYAIPEKILRIPSLPLTTNGKINVKELPNPFSVQMKISEKDNISEEIENIWKELLEKTSVARDVSFFQLGGNSIKAALLVRRINEKFNEEKKCMDIVDVFRYPTLAEQQKIIKERIKS